jgi:hypothetical protein
VLLLALMYILPGGIAGGLGQARTWWATRRRREARE